MREEAKEITVITSARGVAIKELPQPWEKGAHINLRKTGTKL